MVNELLNNIYEVKDDEGETLYDGSAIYQNVFPNTDTTVRYDNVDVTSDYATTV